MGLGIYALVDSDSLKDFIHIIDSDLDVNLFGLAGGLIVGVSLIIAAIAFFGCCGAVKVRICLESIAHFSLLRLIISVCNNCLPQESRCLLGIYMLILLGLFGAMIAGAVLAAKSNGLEVVKDPMYKSLSAYDPANSDSGDNEKAWNAMQDSVRKIVCDCDRLSSEFSEWCTQVERSAKVDAPGCVNAAGKLGQK